MICENSVNTIPFRWMKKFGEGQTMATEKREINAAQREELNAAMERARKRTGR